MRNVALAVVASAVLSTQVQAGLFFFPSASKAPAAACKPAPAPACKPAPACPTAPKCHAPCPIKASLQLPKLTLPKLDLLSLFRCNRSASICEEELPESDLGEATDGGLEPSAADDAPKPKKTPKPPAEDAPKPKATPKPPAEGKVKPAAPAKPKAPAKPASKPAAPAEKSA